LAAYALAEASSLSILRVDLSRAVSTYIGETEKNKSGAMQAYS
jgi:hypothetical protein